MYDYDMLVIVSGPSGRRAAIQFAKLNRTVLVKRPAGGSAHRPAQSRRDRGRPSRPHRGRSADAEDQPAAYAAGDVIGFPSLASTSMEQGRVAACHALGMEPLAPPEFFPPTASISVPEISTTGLTEEEVRTRRIPYEVGVARFRETSRGHIMGLKQRHDEEDLLDQDPPTARRPHSRRVPPN